MQEFVCGSFSGIASIGDLEFNNRKSWRKTMCLSVCLIQTFFVTMCPECPLREIPCPLEILPRIALIKDIFVVFSSHSFRQVHINTRIIRIILENLYLAAEFDGFYWFPFRRLDCLDTVSVNFITISPSEVHFLLYILGFRKKPFQPIESANWEVERASE